jgi:phospholipase C
LARPYRGGIDPIRSRSCGRRWRVKARFPFLFLKAANYQDGHAGYSDPIDEQHFVVETVNELQQSKDWKSTAVIIAYDDSDGWYDHAMAPIVNSSHDAAADALNAAGACGNGTGMGGYQDRCGYGPRLPLLVVSPTPRPTTSTTRSPTSPRS